MRTIGFIPFLIIPAAITFAMAPVRTLSAEAVGGRIEQLDPALEALVPADAKIEVLAEGLDWVEGPVWRKRGGYVLFVDIPQNTIYRWKEGDGLSIFLRPAGHTEANPPPEGRELAPGYQGG